MISYEFDVPIQVISEANYRGNRWAKVRRTKQQRGKAYAYCIGLMGVDKKGHGKKFPGRYLVTLTRIMGKGQRPFDSDNLQSSFKAIRDGIADYLEVNDNSDRYTWRYQQEKGSKSGIRVGIDIEPI